MKICIYLVISVMCFCSCSTQGAGSSTGNNKNLVVNTSNQSSKIDPNGNQSAYTNKTTEVSINSRRQPGSFRVDSYEDIKLVSRSLFQRGQLKKEISYNLESKSEEFITEYFYTKNGDFERLKVTKGDDSVLNEIFTQSVKDLEFQNQILNSNGIEFPLPDIAADEVRDLSKILAVADNYSDFKTETQNDGNRKIIKFVGFNKNIRFQPSTITLVVGNNPIHIKDFELTLENNFPIKESLKTDDGELTKTYSYEDGRLTGLVYKFTDLQNQSSSLEKRFEYHDLNQKP